MGSEPRVNRELHVSDLTDELIQDTLIAFANGLQTTVSSLQCNCKTFEECPETAAVNIRLVAYRIIEHTMAILRLASGVDVTLATPTPSGADSAQAPCQEETT